MPRFVLAVLVLLVAAAPAAARLQLPDPLPVVSGNPADALAAEPIEDFGYDPATDCTPDKKRPGMAKFAAWLEANVRGESWGIYRCEKWGKHQASLHAEGRAIDWHLDVTDHQDAKAAERLIRLLLAPDKAGQPQALARRMGIEEIIWDCGYLSVGMNEFSKYSACFDKHGRRKKKVDPTQGHRNHVHLGMTRRGAAGKTSFWAS